MGIATGIAKANAELSYPMNIVEGVRIAAVGAAQIAAISQQRFSSAYDDGRRIPAVQFGIVGERGPATTESQDKRFARPSAHWINSMCAGQLSRDPFRCLLWVVSGHQLGISLRRPPRAQSAFSTRPGYRETRNPG